MRTQPIPDRPPTRAPWRRPIVLVEIALAHMNRPSLLHGLEVGLEAVPAQLVDDEHIRGLQRAAQRLPSDCSTWCVELRLDGRSDRVDLQAHRVVAPRSAAPSTEPNHASLGPPAHDDVARQLHACGLWFELDDVTHLDAHTREPCIYASLVQKADQRPICPADQVTGAIGDRQSHGRLTPRAIECAWQRLGTPLHAQLSTAIAKLLAQLPDYARVNHLGWMAPRGHFGLRLALEYPPQALPALMKCLNWPGNIGQLSRYCQRTRGWISRGCATLDLAEDGQLQPRIGIEFFIDPQAPTTHWPDMSQWLVESGWAEASRARAMLTWPGRARIDSEFVVQRFIRHVKVWLGPDETPHAKAYLFGQPHFSLFGSSARLVRPDARPNGVDLSLQR